MGDSNCCNLRTDKSSVLLERLTMIYYVIFVAAGVALPFCAVVAASAASAILDRRRLK